ncbi:MAG: type II toxin-antitoxin system RelE/ParE family toxin [Roseburia sp.]|nr:type II toxin-antitoxin system RelE/ParE family toxin [Roseburia sp.]
MEAEKYKSLIVKQAEDDIRETLAYISEELQNPQAAQKLWSDILNAVDTITTYPYSMPKLKNKKITLGNEYRRTEVKNFVIVYKVIEETKELRIMAVLYGASDVVTKLTERI